MGVNAYNKLVLRIKILEKENEELSVELWKLWDEEHERNNPKSLEDIMEDNYQEWKKGNKK